MVDALLDGFRAEADAGGRDGARATAILQALGELRARSKEDVASSRARAALSLIAVSYGLGTDEMDERSELTLDLDAESRVPLDFGARSFRIGFSNDLEPQLFDADDKPLADLPKPGKKDDAEKAKAARERWKELRAEAKEVAASVSLGLERAMTSGRRWSRASFEERVLASPVGVRLARRLVWGAFQGGALRSTFRVAEDGSLADVNDRALTLDDTSEIGLPHPMQLGADAVAAWCAVMDDYELLQPFEQLRRRVFSLPQDEAELTSLDLHAGAVFGTLRNAGSPWRAEQDSYRAPVSRLRARLRDGAFTVTLSPGVDPTNVPNEPRQSISALTLTGTATPLETSEALHALWTLAGRPAARRP